jgi:hypothetical protein
MRSCQADRLLDFLRNYSAHQLWEMDNLIYAICGDWVDSCTAVVEHLDGRFELVRWGAQPAVPAARSAEVGIAAA